MLDRLALDMEIGERASSDSLGVKGECLARLEALRAPVETVRAGQQLLPLLKSGIRWVIAVPAAEEGGPVIRKTPQFAPVAVHVRVPVAEPLVDFGAGC